MEMNEAKIINDTYADEWAEGYPLGNGRIGAMIWGEPTKEVLSLNHELLWRRYLKHPNYQTAKDVPAIKSLCQQNKWREAEELLLHTIPYTGETIYINPFVPAFDLYISLYRNGSDAKNYRRELDLEHGVSTASYQIDGVNYYSTSFCDSVDGLLYTHLYSDRPSKLIGEISLSRILDCECTVTGGADYDGVYCAAEFEEGVRFAAYSAIYNIGGRLTTGKKTYGIDGEEKPPKKFGLGYVFDRNEGVMAQRGCSVCMDSCDEVWIVTALSIDLLENDPLAACKIAAGKHTVSDFHARLYDHKAAFAKYFNRTRLYLPENREQQDMFDMARYIAIASGMSMESVNGIHTPIHLQGLWNRDTRPAWESDYHLDLNIQMCYWPLPSMGLADFMEPYLCWMERLLPQARATAKNLYDAKGACYNGCSDPWTLGMTDNVGYGALGISAWLADMLYLYYEHVPSEKLLSRILAIMAEIDEFYRSMLLEDNGQLTFAFGLSPEMSLMIGDQRQWLSSPSTFDLTAVRAFYQDYQTLSRISGHTEVSAECTKILEKLAKPTIDKNGILQEWTQAHTEGEPGHRHRSPFVAFCPGTLYSKDSDPEMTAAMERLLEKRLSCGNGVSTAFSYAWDAQILARLNRGDDALAMLKTLQKIHALKNRMLTTNDYDGKNGGISWFTGVKVVQVEAQIASAAALAEMFYSDVQNVIRLLPALPKEIPSGAFYGIHGRNGIICDLTWEAGKLKEFRIRTTVTQDYKIRVPDGNFSIAGQAYKAVQEGNTITLHASPYSEYRFVRT